VDVAQKKLSAAKGRLAPSVDAEFAAGRSLNKEAAEVGDARSKRAISNISATLSVTIPIFENHSGSNTYSAIDLAYQEVLRAKVEHENAVLDTHNKCVKAWNSYIAAGAMIKAGRSTVKSRELSSESVLEGLALGMKSNVDVLTEEEKLLEARIDLAKSQKTKIDAAVELLMLRGDLSAESFIGRIRAKDKLKLQKTQKKIGNYVKKMSYSPRERMHGE
jgi:outer membrane protein TolC